MSLFNIPTPNHHSTDANATLEWLVRRLLALKPRIAAVLRCGQSGCCYALTADLPPGTLTNDTLDAVPVYWGAPFHQSQDKVKDPTGAGNAFMGGLMAALYEGKDIHEGEFGALHQELTVQLSFGLMLLHRSSSNKMGYPRCTRCWGARCGTATTLGREWLRCRGATLSRADML